MIYMSYNHPEEIPVQIANDLSGCDAATRAAVIDNAQCIAFIAFWMLDNDITDYAGFTFEVSEENYVWINIRLCYHKRCFCMLRQSVRGDWVVTLGSDGTEAQRLAGVASSLGCRF